MGRKQLSDDELEEELEKAYQKSENQKIVFKIIREEESSLDLKDKKIKFKRKD